MLSRKPGKKLNKYVSDYVVFDLETTGVSCNSDEVVEISAIKVIGGEVVDEFTTLVNPGRPIPYHASEVNGITDDMVKDSPFFEEVLFHFLEFVGDLVLVGHNIHTFDMKFLYRDAERFWGKTIGNDYIDTLQIARIYLPQLSHYKLVDLAKYYGISTVGAHRALNDCRMNQIVFEQLAKEMANPSEDTKAVKKCPKCGNVLRKRKGRYGEFWGCMSYPDCTYTRNI
ncbi:MAG: DNA polymerase III subunit epsilon [Lachnospiraceae bacterium]|nr:DNA polymerase III subunit epsilon [Lachnospiraceae bacterium]